jgi:hypothetical protein
MTPVEALAGSLTRPLSDLLGTDGAIVLTEADREVLLRLA